MAVAKSIEIHPEITCPHCWHRFPSEDVLWVSVSPSLRGDSRLGAQGQMRFLPSRFTLDGKAVDPEGSPCDELACPRCHLFIPRALLEMNPFFVSIIGSPGSGKTYFLASMTYRLREVMPGWFGHSFTDSQPDVNLILNQYEDQQFYNADRDAVIKLRKTGEVGDWYQTVTFPPNQPVTFPRPFFFSIRSTRDQEATQSQDVFRPIQVEEKNQPSSHVLCLYDNAGESYLPGADDASAPVTRHIASAQSLLFLFDPTQVEKIRMSLQGKTEDPQVTSNLVTHKHETVLHELTARVRRFTGLAENEKSDVPLIIVVTKFDAWCHLLNANTLPPACKNEGNGSVAQLDMETVMKVSGVVRKALLHYSQEFISAAENFSSRVYYVPVSATGSAPEVNETNEMSGHRPRDIKPAWAEVPMLLALNLCCNNVVHATE